MAAQHVELTLELFITQAREEVAGVAVLRHHPQRLLLAGAADHNGRVRALYGLRRVQRALELVVLAVIWLFVARPHLQRDLQCLFQPLEALGRRGDRHTQPTMLLLVPRRADAEIGAPTREYVERRRGL